MEGSFMRLVNRGSRRIQRQGSSEGYLHSRIAKLILIIEIPVH